MSLGLIRRRRGGCIDARDRLENKTTYKDWRVLSPDMIAEGRKEMDQTLMAKRSLGQNCFVRRGKLSRYPFCLMDHWLELSIAMAFAALRNTHTATMEVHLQLHDISSVSV